MKHAGQISNRSAGRYTEPPARAGQSPIAPLMVVGVAAVANICNGLRCFWRYKGSVPPPAGREVFPVFEDSFLTRRGAAINGTDVVRYHPHRVLQGLKVIWVSAREVSCESV